MLNPDVPKCPDNQEWRHFLAPWDTVSTFGRRSTLGVALTSELFGEQAFFGGNGVRFLSGQKQFVSELARPL